MPACMYPYAYHSTHNRIYYRHISTRRTFQFLYPLFVAFTDATLTFRWATIHRRMKCEEPIWSLGFWVFSPKLSKLWIFVDDQVSPTSRPHWRSQVRAGWPKLSQAQLPLDFSHFMSFLVRNHSSLMTQWLGYTRVVDFLCRTIWVPKKVHRSQHWAIPRPLPAPLLPGSPGRQVHFGTSCETSPPPMGVNLTQEWWLFFWKSRAHQESPSRKKQLPTR